MSSTETIEQEEYDTLECPGCSASLTYSAKVEMLHCEYCDSTLDVSKLSAPSGHLDETALEELFKEKLAKLPVQKIVVCGQCGAQTTMAGSRSNTECSFCASELVEERDSSGETLQPTALIPFSVSREKATSEYGKWLSSLWFRPNDLTKAARLASLEGVYCPFWTFDAQAESRWTAQSGKYYFEKKKYTDNEGKERTKRVRKVKWSSASGNRNGDYDDVLVTGSKGINESMLEALEPFHTQKNLKPYQTEFVAGWAVEECQVPASEAWQSARTKIRKQEYQECRSDVPGDTAKDLSVSTHLTDTTGRHILLPVWVAAYRYKNESYHFLVNGETGEVSGKAPYSVPKIVMAVLFALFVIFSVLGTGGAALVIWIPLAFLVGGIYLIKSLMGKKKSAGSG